MSPGQINKHCDSKSPDYLLGKGVLGTVVRKQGMSKQIIIMVIVIVVFGAMCLDYMIRVDNYCMIY